MNQQNKMRLKDYIKSTSLSGNNPIEAFPTSTRLNPVWEKKKGILGIDEEAEKELLNKRSLLGYVARSAKGLPDLPPATPKQVETKDVVGLRTEKELKGEVKKSLDEQRVSLFEKIKEWINPNAVKPVKNNNPGNLKRPEGGLMLYDILASKDKSGNVLTDEDRHYIFPNAAVGWNAAYTDLDAKMSGNTRNPLLAEKAGVGVTIADLNQAYAEDKNWKNGVVSIYNKLTNGEINPLTDVSTLDRDALQLAVLTQEGFLLPKIDYKKYSELMEKGITQPEKFVELPEVSQEKILAGEMKEPTEYGKFEAKVGEGVEFTPQQILSLGKGPLRQEALTEENKKQILLGKQFERAEKEAEATEPIAFFDKGLSFNYGGTPYKPATTKQKVYYAAGQIASFVALNKLLAPLGIAKTLSTTFNVSKYLSAIGEAEVVGGVIGAIEKKEPETPKLKQILDNAAGFGLFTAVAYPIMAGLKALLFPKYVKVGEGEFFPKAIVEEGTNIVPYKENTGWVIVGKGIKSPESMLAGKAKLGLRTTLTAKAGKATTPIDEQALYFNLKGYGGTDESVLKVIPTKEGTVRFEGYNVEKSILRKALLKIFGKTTTNIKTSTIKLEPEVVNDAIKTIKEGIKTEIKAIRTAAPEVNISKVPKVAIPKITPSVPPVKATPEKISVEKKITTPVEAKKPTETEVPREVPKPKESIKTPQITPKPEVKPVEKPKIEAIPKELEQSIKKAKAKGLSAEEFVNRRLVKSNQENLYQKIRQLMIEIKNPSEIDKKVIDEFGKDPEITLYRGINKALKPSPFESDITAKVGRFWSPNRAHAELFARQDGKLYEVKVKVSDLLKSRFMGKTKLLRKEVELANELQQNATEIPNRYQLTDIYNQAVKEVKPEVKPKTKSEIEPEAKPTPNALERAKQKFQEEQKLKKKEKVRAKIKEKKERELAVEKFKEELSKPKAKSKMVKKAVRSLSPESLNEKLRNAKTPEEADKIEKMIQREFDKRASSAMEEIENPKVKKDLKLYQIKAKVSKEFPADYGLKVIESYKKRLGLNIDVNITDLTLLDQVINGKTRRVYGVASPYLGKITLNEFIDEFTAEHEIVELLFQKENFDRIPAFRGISRNGIINDITHNLPKSDREVSEELARRFEKYVNDKKSGNNAEKNVKGKFIRRFFHAVWNALKKIWEAIGKHTGVKKPMSDIEKFYEALYSSEVRGITPVETKITPPPEIPKIKTEVSVGSMTKKQNAYLAIIKKKYPEKYNESLQRILGKETHAGITRQEASDLISDLKGKAKDFLREKRYKPEIDAMVKSFELLKPISKEEEKSEVRKMIKRVKNFNSIKTTNEGFWNHVSGVELIDSTADDIRAVNSFLGDAYMDTMFWNYNKKFDFGYFSPLKEMEKSLREVVKNHKTSIGWAEVNRPFLAKDKRTGNKKIDNLRGGEITEILLGKSDEGIEKAILRDGIVWGHTENKEDILKLNKSEIKIVWEKAPLLYKDIAKEIVRGNEIMLEAIAPMMKKMGMKKIEGEEGYAPLIRTFLFKFSFSGISPEKVFTELIYQMSGHSEYKGKTVETHWKEPRMDVITGRAVSGKAISNYLHSMNIKFYFAGVGDEVYKLNSIVNNKYWKDSFIEHFGEARWLTLYHWAKGLISPQRAMPTDKLSRETIKYSRNAAYSFILFKLTTAIFQANSLAMGISAGGIKTIPYYFATIPEMMFYSNEIKEFVKEKFPEVKDRFTHPIMAELQQVVANSKIGALKNNIYKASAAISKFFDGVVVPILYANYQAEMARSGNPDLAYKKAMEVFLTTQPSSFKKDLPIILGGGDEASTLRILTGMLRNQVTKISSYTALHIFNPKRIYKLQKGKVSEKVLKTMAIEGWRAFWTIAVMGIITFILKHGRAPKKEKDLVEMFLYPFVGIFGVGHLLSAANYGIYGYSLIIEEVFNRIIYALSAMKQGKYNKMLTHLVAFGTAINGLPWTQSQLAFNYVLDGITDTDEFKEWKKLFWSEKTLEETKNKMKGSFLNEILFSPSELGTDLLKDLDLGL